MTTVTVYTAARVKQVEDASIVDGEIIGNDLILRRFDETEINAGNVRGPQGIPGTPVPTGTIIMGGWASDPSGYLILDGALVVGGAVTYPGLALAYPGWVTGSNLQLPNAVGSVPMGAPTAGVVSGSMSHTISEAQMPAHVHTGPSHTHTGPSHSHDMGHNHTASSQPDPATHYHSIAQHSHAGSPNTGAYGYVLRGAASGAGLDVVNAGTDIALYYVANPPTSVGGPTTTSGDTVWHSHVVNVANYVGNTVAAGTGATGASGTDPTGVTGSGSAVNHTPKNLSVKFAVKTG